MEKIAANFDLPDSAQRICSCLNVFIDTTGLDYNSEAQVIGNINGYPVYSFLLDGRNFYIWVKIIEGNSLWVITVDSYDDFAEVVANAGEYLGICPNSVENSFTWIVNSEEISLIETSSCTAEQTSCNSCDSIYVDIEDSSFSGIQTIIANKIGEFNGFNLYSFTFNNTIYYIWSNLGGGSWNISSGGYGDDPSTYIAGMKLDNPCPDSINNEADWALYNSWESLNTSAPCRCIKIIYSTNEGESFIIEVQALPNLYNDKPIYFLPIEGIPGGSYLYFENSWKVGSNVFTLESLNSCPYGLFSAGISSPLQSFLVIPDCECPSNTEAEEEQNCFKLLVWQKQCEFAKCALNYIQQLQLGMMDCCELFEDLKNKRRILRILNCYDVRDIPNDTMDYNSISYSEIKKLLNC